MGGAIFIKVSDNVKIGTKDVLPQLELKMNDLSTSYLFWFGWLFGLAGLHRLHNKKMASGFLWLFTFGLLGFGQLLDLVLIPGMVDEHNQQVKNRLGLSPTGVPLSQSAIATAVYQPPTRDQLMVKLLKAAHSRGGQISVTQGVLDTGASFAEVEATLKAMVQTGYVTVDNHPASGVVIYDFIEL